MNRGQLVRKTSPYIAIVIIAFLENSNSALRIIEANIAETLARADLMLLNSSFYPGYAIMRVRAALAEEKDSKTAEENHD
jgi:hypothetical protein